MSQAETELRAMSQMALELENRIHALRTEIQRLQMLKEDVDVAIEAIDSISNDITIQVPLGSETYVQASIQNSDEFVVNIGGDYSLKQTKEQTKSTLSDRANSIVSQIEEISKAIKELQSKGDEIKQKAQEHMSQLQSQNNPAWNG
jgi:prefoldin alpha subunit|tara:strand:- start:135 stop:572 length:438 start_codon:yes stop_codon:yes gene_type:complete